MSEANIIYLSYSIIFILGVIIGFMLKAMLIYINNEIKEKRKRLEDLKAGKYD